MNKAKAVWIWNSAYLLILLGDAALAFFVFPSAAAVSLMSLLAVYGAAWMFAWLVLSGANWLTSSQVTELEDFSLINLAIFFVVTLFIP